MNREDIIAIQRLEARIRHLEESFNYMSEYISELEHVLVDQGDKGESDEEKSTRKEL